MSGFRFTVTPSSKSVFVLEQFDLSDEEVTELVAESEPGEKDGAAMILALFRDCPGVCIGSGKDCGGNRPHRLDGNVSSVTGLGIDVDHIPSKAAFLGHVERLRKHGLKHWWWETYSSKPDAFRARLILPFAEPMPIHAPSQWKYIAWPAMTEFLGLRGVTNEVADESCKNAGRVFYLSSMPQGAPPREWGFVNGEPLDWKVALAAKGQLDTFNRVPRPLQAPARAECKTARASGTPEEIASVRRSLRDYGDRCPARKKRAILNLLAGKMPGTLPSQRKPGEQSRNETWKEVLWALAVVAPEHVASEALLEHIVRPAWDDEWQASGLSEDGDDFTEWDVVESLFERGREKAATQRAQREAERAAFAGRYSDSPNAMQRRERVLKHIEQTRRKAGGR